MENFFQRVPYGGEAEFHLFTIEYYLTVLVCTVLIIGFFLLTPKIKKMKNEKSVRYVLGIFMLLSSVTIYLYAYSNSLPWYMYLPEATCGWAIYLGGIALITKNRTCFVLTFFWSWGAITTLLFSNILDGPTRYNFYQFFIRHVLILIVPIYFMRILEYKLYKSDFNLYVFITLPMAIIGGIISHIVNKPDMLNMFYMMQPASNTPILDIINDYNHILYIVLWLILAIIIGYLYGLPFYERKTPE